MRNSNKSSHVQNMTPYQAIVFCSLASRIPILMWTHYAVYTAYQVFNRSTVWPHQCHSPRSLGIWSPTNLTAASTLFPVLTKVITHSRQGIVFRGPHCVWGLNSPCVSMKGPPQQVCQSLATSTVSLSVSRYSGQVPSHDNRTYLTGLHFKTKWSRFIGIFAAG